MHCYSWGDTANFRNSDVRTREKRGMRVSNFDNRNADKAGSSDEAYDLFLKSKCRWDND